MVVLRGGLAAAPADGTEEEGELRRAFGGATELEMRKEQYEDGEGNEADLVEGLVGFFAHRGGHRNSGKLLPFLSLLFFLSLSRFSSLWVFWVLKGVLVEVWSMEGRLWSAGVGSGGCCCDVGFLQRMERRLV